MKSEYILAILMAMLVAGCPLFGTAPAPVGGSSNSGSVPSTNSPAAPSAPTVGTNQPDIMIINSVIFCTQVDADKNCVTNESPFPSSVKRVYATMTYTSGQVGALFAWSWLKEGDEVGGDGASLLTAAGKYTTSLTRDNMADPLASGTYTFEVIDENNKILKSQNFEVSST